MMGRTHLAAGLCVGGAAAYALDPKLFFPAVSIAMVTSLIPDIDHSSSLLGRYVKPVGWVLKHRGITHTVFFALVLSIVCFIYLLPLYGYVDALSLSLVAFLGVLSHLLLDVLATKPQFGLPLFYVPFLNKRPGRYGFPITSSLIYTNSLLERVVFRTGLLGLGAVMMFAAFMKL